MDVKEKLVGLIHEAPYTIYGDRLFEILTDSEAIRVAEYLISNGVTVQAWISVDAVPVSELKKLRDYLYEEDLIFMRGLAELNKLIANYCADGKRKENDNGVCNTL